MFIWGVLCSTATETVGLEWISVDDVSAILISFTFLCVCARARGTHRGELFGMPPTNKTMAMPMVHIYDFEAGKVKRWRTYANYQTMMQQLSSE